VLQLDWFENVSGVYLVNFPLLLIGQLGWDIFSAQTLDSQWTGILQSVRQQQEKITHRTPLTLSEVSTANQTTFIIGQLFSSLVIRKGSQK
jgi:hypothetical protein